jgi:hypothetical protein
VDLPSGLQARPRERIAQVEHSGKMAAYSWPNPLDAQA